jgi:two-component system response regulator
MSSVERTILLVEDDPAAQRLFEEAMAESQIASFRLATTGREALSLLTESDAGGGDHGLPDMIVLDLHLPDMSGLDLLETLKSSETPLRRIPVLLLSTSTKQEHVDRAYDLGVNAYLAKPDGYGDLLALMEELRSFWLRRIEFPTH